MKSKLAGYDIVSLAKAAPLVAQILPKDSLAELAMDYRMLRGMAGAKTPTKLQKDYYQACLEVLDTYSIYLFRRNLALLLIWAGNLYRLEYRSFPEFALARANLKKSQAHKACANALMTLIFDGPGKRHLMPVGDMEEALVTLMPDHWLTAWEHVLSSTDGDLDIDHVKIALHAYCVEHPSARPQRRRHETRLLPAILPISSNDEEASASDNSWQLKKLEAALLQTPFAAQLNTHATAHKRSMAAFTLEALRALPLEAENELPAPAVLLKLLEKLDPAVTKRAEQVAAAQILRWIAQAGERRHHHLEKRRAEYLRRRSRKQAGKRL